MQAVRAKDSNDGIGFKLAPGEIAVCAGHWMACTPNGYLADLCRHDVTEHPGGTITVSPSILVSTEYDGQRQELWHGWLKAGVWSSC